MRQLSSALLSAFLLPALHAQDNVRIVKVPDSLRLPAATGANLLVEVEVSSAPDACWLATDAAAQDRLPLQDVGQRRFQANLADPRLFDLLPAGRDQGSLFVFARFGARTVQSPAIAWARNTRDDGKVRCIVRSRGKPARTALPDERLWLDASTLERLELQGAGARQSAAVLRLADVELPLVRRAEEQLWVLDVDARMRERLVAADVLELELRLGPTSTLFEFQCVPPRLDLQDPVTTFVVPQRKRKFLPGSRDWLQVRIDDITMGHVLMEIVAADGSVVVPEKLVQERDWFELELAGARYVLSLKKLENLLIGDDHAEFQLQDASTFRPDRIGQLLRAIEASTDTFVREGKDYPGPAAAQFLIAKLGSHRGKVIDVDEFVERFASQSSRTGEPYHVRNKDGAVVTMREWLIAARQRIEAADAKQEAGKQEGRPKGK
ncbi:MAG TPA: DUF5329 family protein [Planctomycetota bacterium]